MTPPPTPNSAANLSQAAAAANIGPRPRTKNIRPELIPAATLKIHHYRPPLTNHSQPHPALPQTTRGHPSPRRPTLSGRQTGSILDLAHDSRLSIKSPLTCEFALVTVENCAIDALRVPGRPEQPGAAEPRWRAR